MGKTNSKGISAGDCEFVSGFGGGTAVLGDGLCKGLVGLLLPHTDVSLFPASQSAMELGIHGFLRNLQ